METTDYWHDKLMRGNTKKDNEETIKQIQNEAYNQCLHDLADNDLLPNKKETILKYSK